MDICVTLVKNNSVTQGNPYTSSTLFSIWRNVIQVAFLIAYLVCMKIFIFLFGKILLNKKNIITANALKSLSPLVPFFLNFSTNTFRSFAQYESKIILTYIANFE